MHWPIGTHLLDTYYETTLQIWGCSAHCWLQISRGAHKCTGARQLTRSLAHPFHPSSFLVKDCGSSCHLVPYYCSFLGGALYRNTLKSYFVHTLIFWYGSSAYGISQTCFEVVRFVMGSISAIFGVFEFLPHVSFIQASTRNETNTAWLWMVLCKSLPKVVTMIPLFVNGDQYLTIFHQPRHMHSCKSFNKKPFFVWAVEGKTVPTTPASFLFKASRKV